VRDRDELNVGVYELARELGVDSYAVMAKLKAMGEYVRTASSTIKAPVADRVRAQFSLQPVKAREDTAAWRPLSRRSTDAPWEDEILYEDVPAHLSQPLIYWLESLFKRAENYRTTVGYAERKAGRVAARVRLDLGSVSAKDASRDQYREDWSDIRALMHLARTQGGAVLLDVVDATLADGVDRLEADELEQLLTDAGSAWHVAADGKALQRRVSIAARQALEATSGTAAAVHLNAAWTAAYGRHPDPSLAYSQAIKAVESVSIPIVLDRDRLATLGRVIGQLDQQPQRYQLAIRAPRGDRQAEITTLLAMLRLLWGGQTDRHGNSAPPVPVTLQAAEAAVHLALTLVHWFQSGAISRTGT
jgi:hypothetical protein